jgi:hypothetical protein
MIKMDIHKVKIVTDTLSDLIRNTLNALSSEQTHPGPDPDRMDDEIRELTNEYFELSEIREKFEILTTRAIVKER